MHQAQRIAVMESGKGSAQLNRFPYRLRKKILFYSHPGIEAPDPGPDLRLRAPGRHGDRLARGGFDEHGFAVRRFAVHPLDCTREDPGVPALHRFVPARPEVQRLHFLRARGCAAS